MDDKNNELPKKKEEKDDSKKPGDNKTVEEAGDEADDKKTVTFEDGDDTDSIEEVLQEYDYNDSDVQETKENDTSELNKVTSLPMKKDSVEITSVTSADLNKFLQQYGRNGSNNSNYSNTMMGEAFIYMKIPPDGGYAWIVLLASVLCLVIADGHTFTMGVVLPTIGEDLNMISSEQALIISTQQGPFSSAFINKFGFIKVGIVGAALATAAYILGAWANGFIYLLLIFGMISGIGFGMIWVTSQLIIGYYFEKYRPIASGVSCAGSGLGMLFFSKLNPFLIRHIGWRNQFRISSVFVAISGLLCLIYVSVKPTIVGKVQIPEEEESGSEQSVVIATARYSKYAVSTTDLGTQERPLETNVQKSTRWSRFKKKIFICCPAYQPKRHKSSDPDANKYVINNDVLDREDIFYTGKADYKKTPDNLKGSIIFPDKKNKTIGYSMSMIRATAPSRKKRRWLHPKISNALDILFDFSLLKIFEFQLLLLSAFLFHMGSNIPFTYIVSRATISESQKSNILPLIGLTNIIFRILAGILTYKFDVDKSYICGGGACLAGGITFLSSFFGNSLVWFQYLYASCFGIGLAIFVSLRALVYVQILGLEKLTNAFGLTSAILGIGVFVGTTLGGILKDVTGTYTASFAFSGLCMFTAGLIKILLPKIISFRSKKKNIK